MSLCRWNCVWVPILDMTGWGTAGSVLHGDVREPYTYEFASLFRRNE